MNYIKPGLKVKVYGYRGSGSNTVRFGETVGVDEKGKLLLAPREDFAQLPLHHINFCLTDADVKFLTSSELPAYRFQNPKQL